MTQRLASTQPGGPLPNWQPAPLRLTAWCAAACLALAMAGCGGGGGGGGDAAANGAASPVAAPAPEPAASGTPPATAASAAVDDPMGMATTLAVANAAVTADAMAQAAQRSLQAEAAVEGQAELVARAGVAALDVAEATPSVVLAAPITPINPITTTPTTTAPATAAPATAAATASTLVVRARASLAAGVGAQMVVRVNGQTVGSTLVSTTQFSDFSFAVPPLAAGSRVDVVFTNDAVINGQDRNLYLAYLQQGSQVVMPTAANATIDRGNGNAAFDGIDTLPGHGNLYWNAAVRLSWPAAAAADTNLARKRDAVRFLLQASFGPTPADINSLVSKPYAVWLSDQMALPRRADYQDAVQAEYDQGDAWRPGGASYTPLTVAQTFWKTAATAPDQLRKRVAFALHQIFMVSQTDSNLWHEARAVAAYHDLLNRHAFGNFRQLMEDIALSPAMGIYLSHMRNRKEDPASGRTPDENFARELMQLFTIGLHELNPDGSPKRDAQGNPVETYSNADVVAMAKVFTGWGWAFADTALTDANFRWGRPVTSAAGDQRIDTLPMKAYAGWHSTAAKALFAGKPWALTIPANGTAQADLKLALDALFNHPNVGPFIGRQLIQRLVTSQPSPAYVARVAAVFNNNGNGVRGDLAAVVRTILLDSEARNPPPAGFGKLREPVLRVAHWARALAAQSTSGKWLMAWDLEGAGQRALMAPSVFGYTRPGYVPPNTSFAGSSSSAPEFQIVNESTVAAWINTAEGLAANGIGWTGTEVDVKVDHAALGALAAGGQLSQLADHLDLLLLGGRMPAGLRQAVLDTIAGIPDSATSAVNRARAATFLVLASPDFISQP